MVSNSCKKSSSPFSNVPQIELKGIYKFENDNGKDSFIELELQLKDGDGNFGLDENDTAGNFAFGMPGYYNLHVAIWQYKNKKWFKPVIPASPKDTANLNYRLPVITPSGRNKWIDAKLIYKAKANAYDLRADTIKYQIFVFDRSLNKSNVVETEPIKIKF